MKSELFFRFLSAVDSLVDFLLVTAILLFAALFVNSLAQFQGIDLLRNFLMPLGRG